MQIRYTDMTDEDGPNYRFSSTPEQATPGLQSPARAQECLRVRAEIREWCSANIPQGLWWSDKGWFDEEFVFAVKDPTYALAFRMRWC